MVELFEKIAGGFRGLAERIVGTGLLVGREIRASLDEIQFVEVAISALEEMSGRIGFHYGNLLRLSRGSIGGILRENTGRRKCTGEQQAGGDPHSVVAQFA